MRCGYTSLVLRSKSPMYLTSFTATSAGTVDGLVETRKTLKYLSAENVLNMEVSLHLNPC